MCAMNGTVKLALLMVIASGVACAQDVPLGDIARQNRQVNSTPVRVFTNDDVGPSTAGRGPQTSPEPTEATPGTGGTEKNRAKAAQPKPKPTDAASFEAEISAWRKAIASQKAEVAKLQNEIDAVQHQIDLQASNYYADPAARLRNPERWMERRQVLDDQLAKKQEKLAIAQQKLEDLRTAARRAGVPSGAID